MTTTDISNVSEDEENFLRMDLLITGICPRAVRVYFDNEFHPLKLKESMKKEIRKLQKLKKTRVISKQQFDLLLPRVGTPNSKTFDVTLMITLLRHLTDLHQPSAGYDTLPSIYNITATDDLARIKHYRNKFAHFEDVRRMSALYNTEWNDIIGAVGRLGGPTLTKECEELRTKCLDRSTVTVPWSIRLNIRAKLNEWRMTDDKFVETLAAERVFECLSENSCVTITASFGVGKTATLQHVALKMAVEGYDVLLVTNPNDIVKFYNPNKKTLFVIDDFCGKYSINQSDLDKWEPVKEKVEELIENKTTKIIVSCRLQVFKDEKFDSLSIFRMNTCNLLSEKICLSQNEKQLIAEKYLKSKANSDIIQYYDLFDCFPLLCTFNHDHFTLSITNLFQNLFQVYEAEIEQLKKNKHFSKYCALALCVMFNNALLEEVLIEEQHIKTVTIIKNTCDACSPEEIPKLTLLDELDSLEHTFIKKDQGVYTALNDKIFDFLSHYFGQNIIQCLIENAHHKLIKDRFLLEIERNMDPFITIVPPKYHQMFIQRMVDDWCSGEVVTVFNNKNMESQTFRHMFLSYLKTLDMSYQKQLANTVDKVYNDTVLIQCCFKDDIPLIKWCCYHVDVNQCMNDGISPLFVSSQKGHTEVVKILLVNKADINKCTSDETSPLFIACQNNHVDIVKLLLDNNADNNKCRNDKTSPLFIACQNNHDDIVKLLLYKTIETIISEEMMKRLCCL